MHARRFACFCLGLWLAGSLFMLWVRAQNLREVDRLLSRENPVATLQLKPLGPEGRTILRYTASEQNRWYLTRWEGLQIAFGTAFFLVMLFGSRENKFVLLGVLLLTLVVLLEKFLITPELIILGRLIDFLPEGQQSAERSRYWIVEVTYYAVEGVKCLIALVLTARMVFSSKRSGRSRDSRRELNRVDKADDRRVYR